MSYPWVPSATLTFPPRAVLEGFAVHGDHLALGINKAVGVTPLSFRSTGKGLGGHTANVHSLLFLRSGQLVTASKNEIILWDMAAMMPASVVPIEENSRGFVSSMAELSDGRIAVCLGGGGPMRFVDLATRQVTLVKAPHVYFPSALVCAGDRLVTMASSKSVCVWDADNVPGPERTLDFDERFFDKYRTCIYSLSASACGTMIVTTSRDHYVRLYRLPDVELVWRVWMPKRKRVMVEKDKGVHHAAFSPTGRFIAVSVKDKTVRVICVKTGDCLFTLEGLETRMDGKVGFTDDGAKVITQRGQTVILWSLFSRAEKCMRALCAGLVEDKDWEAQEVCKEVATRAKRWYPLG
jgi:WD40 repeat protein